MARAVVIADAAARYFAVIFIFGFVFGILRVLILAPAMGAVNAVLIELPIMLWLSWRVSAFILHKKSSLDGTVPRALVGVTALGMLLLAEMALATLGFGQSVSTWTAGLVTTEGALGLAGQFLFACMPVAEWHTRQRR